jgi:SAM-dependent methyltransferase
MGTFREFEFAAWEDPATCAGYHDRLGVVVAQAVEPLLDAALAARADRVADVATGTGVVATAAARRDALVLGLDFSAEQLRRACDAPLIVFVRADAGALPLADASVDVVVSNFGMPHFPDPEAFLSESARVLRPAGRLAFTVWAAPPRSPTFAAVLGALARHGTLDVGLPTGPDFFRYTDPATATHDLTAAGFVEVSSTIVAQTWEVPTADHAVDALLHGTVRTAACSPGNQPVCWTRSDDRRGNSWRRTTRAACCASRCRRCWCGRRSPDESARPTCRRPPGNRDRSERHVRVAGAALASRSRRSSGGDPPDRHVTAAAAARASRSWRSSRCQA